MNVQTRSHRGPSSRASILATARDAFLRHGFTDASVDMIAQRSGVSKTTLYAHFDSKEALFNQVVVSAVTEYNAEAAALLDLPLLDPPVLEPGPGDGFRARLAAISARILSVLMEPGSLGLMRLCIVEGARIPRESYEALSQARSGLLRALARWFHDQAAANGLRIPDPQEAAELFLLLSARHFQREAMLPWPAISTPEARRRNAEQAADLMLRLYGRQVVPDA